MTQDVLHGSEGGQEVIPFPVLDAPQQKEVLEYFGGMLQDMRSRLRANRALGERALVAVGPSEDYVEHDGTSGSFEIGVFSNN